MTLLVKLLRLFTCIIFVFSLLSMMGCETGLQDRLTMVENDLSETQGELNSVRGELSTVEGELRDTQEALEECQESGLGVLKVENDYASGSIVSLHIALVGDGWGGQWLGAPIPSFTFRHFGLLPGTYDIKAIFSNGFEVISQRTILPGEFTTAQYS
jgi:hypothetical protein